MKTTAPAAGIKTSGTKQFLLFGQGGSLFGVELDAVREVLSLKEQPISPVPNTLPFLLGLTNLRGEILAAADFGRFTGLDPVDTEHPSSRILVVEAPDPRDVRLSRMRMGSRRLPRRRSFTSQSRSHCLSTRCQPRSSPILKRSVQFRRTLAHDSRCRSDRPFRTLVKIENGELGIGHGALLTGYC